MELGNKTPLHLATFFCTELTNLCIRFIHSGSKSLHDLRQQGCAALSARSEVNVCGFRVLRPRCQQNLKDQRVFILLVKNETVLSGESCSIESYLGIMKVCKHHLSVANLSGNVALANQGSVLLHPSNMWNKKLLGTSASLLVTSALLQY